MDGEMIGDLPIMRHEAGKTYHRTGSCVEPNLADLRDMEEAI